eukprot:6205491-Pleurochrysis_carterae.AAC.2
MLHEPAAARGARAAWASTRRCRRRRTKRAASPPTRRSARAPGGPAHRKPCKTATGSTRGSETELSCRANGTVAQGCAK